MRTYLQRFLFSVCVAILLMTSAESRASLTFSVDDEIKGTIRLSYEVEQTPDLSSYDAIEVVFDDLEFNDGSFQLAGILNSTMGAGGFTRTSSLTQTGSQIATIPMPLSFSLTGASELVVWIGGFEHEANTSGVVSEIRFRSSGSMGSPLLIDNFSGPDVDDSISIPSIVRRQASITRNQLELNVERVLGGEREVRLAIKENSSGGVAGAQFSIDGDGTGRAKPTGIPEPSSLLIWLPLIGLIYLCARRQAQSPRPISTSQQPSYTGK